MTISLGSAMTQPAASTPTRRPAIGIGQATGSADPIPVPTVFGAKRDDAVKLLSGFGFTPIVVDVPGPGEIGDVYGQQPKPGELAARGAAVRVFVIAEQPADELGKRLDALDAAVAKVQEAADALATKLETEEAAKARHSALLEAISNLGSPSKANVKS